MLSNFFKVAWRSLLRHPLYSLVNILGLALGMSVVLLIGFYLQSEGQVNKTLRNIDRQYVLESEWQEEGLGLPFTTLAPLGKALVEEYPNLVANTYRIHGVLTNVSAGDKHFRVETQIGDPTLIEMFGFKLLAGDAHTVLSDPNAILIMEELAQKLFGHSQVVGEVVTLETSIASTNPSGKKDYRIGGVMKRPPFNSVISYGETDYTAFLPMANIDYFAGKDVDQDWGNAYLVAMIELQAGVKPEELKAPMAQLIKTHTKPSIAENLQPQLRPLETFHLQEGNGRRLKILLTLSLVALFILGMAIINFINISIGQASDRLKEIGIRKVLGGHRLQLVGQFLAEACLQAMIAFVIALGSSELFLPAFVALVGSPVGTEHISMSEMIPWLIPIALLTGLMAGLYPAIVLSGFRPIASLKGKLSQSPLGKRFRQGLLIFQFGLAVFLLAAGYIVKQQVDFFFEKDLGYNPHQVLVATSVPRDWSPVGYEKIAASKREFERIPGVEAVSLSFEMMDGRFGLQGAAYVVGQQPEEARPHTPVFCDEAYADVYELAVQEGYFLKDGNAARISQDVVVNQEFVRRMGWDNALGKQLLFPDTGPEQRWRVVGVVKDYHFGSLHTEIPPMLFIHQADWPLYRYLSFRLSPGQESQLIEEIATHWQAIFPNTPFISTFMQDTLQSMYRSEIRMRKAARIATLLGLLIVLLGLFGLLSQSLAQRQKEISIRKILGASPFHIVFLLGKEYALLLGLASLFALPIAYLLMQKWLNGFAYPASNGWGGYALAVLTVAGLAGLLILLQGELASRRNPARVLRDE